MMTSPRNVSDSPSRGFNSYPAINGEQRGYARLTTKPRQKGTGATNPINLDSLVPFCRVRHKCSPSLSRGTVVPGGVERRRWTHQQRLMQDTTGPTTTLFAISTTDSGAAARQDRPTKPQKNFFSLYATPEAYMGGAAAPPKGRETGSSATDCRTIVSPVKEGGATPLPCLPPVWCEWWWLGSPAHTSVVGGLAGEGSR